VYLIDAIDLAIEVGMGKRTNTVLQSAFFSLAKASCRRRTRSST
jgi:pyruvate-ferredoxin/flavodoxin oxidoreductase